MDQSLKSPLNTTCSTRTDISYLWIRLWELSDESQNRTIVTDPQDEPMNLPIVKVTQAVASGQPTRDFVMFTAWVGYPACRENNMVADDHLHIEGWWRSDDGKLTEANIDYGIGVAIGTKGGNVILIANDCWEF